MEILLARTKLAAAFFVALAALCMTPVGAEKKPRLLFLGISSPRYVREEAESAVQLRLTGLGLEVMRPKGVHVPPCESMECLSKAVVTENTHWALVGRILKNEHACIVTLWLLTEKDMPPTQQDLVCRTDGPDEDLIDYISSSAGEMVENHLRIPEPATDLSRLCLLPKDSDLLAAAEAKKHWNWRRKTAVIGLSALLAGSIAAAISIVHLDKNVSSAAGAAAVSAAGGVVAASLLFSSIK